MRFRLLDTVGGRAMRVLTLFMLLCSAYDAFGNRATKTVGGVTTTYLVEDDANPTGYAQVLDELQNGAVTRSYSYGLQRISQTQVVSNAVTTSYYGYDGGGNVRQLTNASGAVTDSYEYDAFGNQLNTSAGNTPNVYLYRGEQYDADLGLYYLRARYYNPATGRFTSLDPEDGKLIDPKSLHKYLYANGDPTNHVDPNGHEALVEVALIDVNVAVRNAAAVTAVVAAAVCILNKTADLLQGVVKPGGAIASITFGVCTAEVKKCRPCDPPVGTLLYRIDYNQQRDHHDKGTGIDIPAGMPHWHLYEVQQSPPSAGDLLPKNRTELTTKS